MSVLVLLSTSVLAPLVAILTFSSLRAKTYHTLVKWNLVSGDWPEQFAKLKLILPAAVPKTAAEKRRAFFLFLGTATCLLVGRIIHLLTPLLLRRILDIIERKSGDFPSLLIILYILLQYLIRDFAFFIQWILLRRLECLIMDTINMSVYSRLMSLSTDYQEGKNTAWEWGDVRDSAATVRKFISDTIFRQLPQIVDVAISIVSFSAISSARMGWTTLLIVVCYTFTMIKTSPRSESARKEYHLARRGRDGHSGETVANWWIVWTFGKIEDERQRYKEVSDHATNVDIKWADNYWLDHNLKNLVVSCGLLLIWLPLARDVWEGKQDKADLVMFIYLWGDLIGPVRDILDWHFQLRAFVVDIENFVDILSLNPSVKDAENAIDYEPHEQGSISCRNVTFHYKGAAPEQSTDNQKSDDTKKSADTEKSDVNKNTVEKTPVLQDISFNIKRGTMVALVGQSGGGKSTLLKLLKRCYDPDEGQVLLDGKDIKRFRQTSLSKSISLVPQNIGAFKRSLLENVRYPRPSASVAECEEICAAVGLEDIPLDTEIGEGGSLLSGGQLQRLAIARALIHDPAILFLDEATNSLDSKTEAKVMECLVQWQKQKNRTIVMVVHAFKSILDRDHTHIIAMKDGRIVEQGTEAELLARKGYYHELWEKQLLDS